MVDITQKRVADRKMFPFFIHNMRQIFLENQIYDPVSAKMNQRQILKFILKDLQAILRMGDSDFWSNLVLNQELKQLLDTFLNFSSRPYRLAMEKAKMHEKSEDFLFYEDDIRAMIAKTVLEIFVRAASPELLSQEMAEGQYEKIIYKTLDIAKLMDLCAIFTPANKTAVSKIFRVCFERQKHFLADLNSSLVLICCNMRKFLKSKGLVSENSPDFALQLDILVNLYWLIVAFPPVAEAYKCTELPAMLLKVFDRLNKVKPFTKKGVREFPPDLLLISQRYVAEIFLHIVGFIGTRTEKHSMETGRKYSLDLNDRKFENTCYEYLAELLGKNPPHLSQTARENLFGYLNHNTRLLKVMKPTLESISLEKRRFLQKVLYLPREDSRADLKKGRPAENKSFTNNKDQFLAGGKSVSAAESRPVSENSATVLSVFPSVGLEFVEAVLRLKGGNTEAAVLAILEENLPEKVLKLKLGGVDPGDPIPTGGANRGGDSGDPGDRGAESGDRNVVGESRSRSVSTRGVKSDSRFVFVEKDIRKKQGSTRLQSHGDILKAFCGSHSGYSRERGVQNQFEVERARLIYDDDFDEESAANDTSIGFGETLDETIARKD